MNNIYENNNEYDLKNILSTITKVDLPDTKRIVPLPNGLLFIVDTRDGLARVPDVINGNGHEPYMIKRIMQFTKAGEVYVEVGANYGDFAIQESLKIGSSGKVYAFEPGKTLFSSCYVSIFLNGIHNIVLENLAISDKKSILYFLETMHSSVGSAVVVDDGKYNQKIEATTLDDYFRNKEEKLDIIRLDAEGNECKVLKGGEDIINKSSDLRIFVEWQTALLNKYESPEEQKDCLNSLRSKGFILINILACEQNCDYKNYQLSNEQILGAEMLEFLAIRESTLYSFFNSY